MTTDPPASWRNPTEALRVVLHLEHLKGTLLTAAVVGTVLFAINQLDTVLGGQATTATWVKTGITYLVPFCVANIGCWSEPTAVEGDARGSRGGQRDSQ